MLTTNYGGDIRRETDDVVRSESALITVVKPVPKPRRTAFIAQQQQKLLLQQQQEEEQQLQEQEQEQQQLFSVQENCATTTVSIPEESEPVSMTITTPTEAPISNGTTSDENLGEAVEVTTLNTVDGGEAEVRKGTTTPFELSATTTRATTLPTKNLPIPVTTTNSATVSSTTTVANSVTDAVKTLITTTTMNPTTKTTTASTRNSGTTLRNTSSASTTTSASSQTTKVFPPKPPLRSKPVGGAKIPSSSPEKGSSALKASLACPKRSPTTTARTATTSSLKKSKPTVTNSIMSKSFAGTVRSPTKIVASSSPDESAESGSAGVLGSMPPNRCVVGGIRRKFEPAKPAAATTATAITKNGVSGVETTTTKLNASRNGAEVAQRNTAAANGNVVGIASRFNNFEKQEARQKEEKQQTTTLRSNNNNNNVSKVLTDVESKTPDSDHKVKPTEPEEALTASNTDAGDDSNNDNNNKLKTCEAEATEVVAAEVSEKCNGTTSSHGNNKMERQSSDCFEATNRTLTDNKDNSNKQQLMRRSVPRTTTAMSLLNNNSNARNFEDNKGIGKSGNNKVEDHNGQLSRAIENFESVANNKENIVNNNYNNNSKPESSGITVGADGGCCYYEGVVVDEEEESDVSASLSAFSSPLRKNVTLLERIVKTHPIWYLPHFGRAAADHLLRPMEPGVFLVRASSRGGGATLSDARGHRSCEAELSAITAGNSNSNVNGCDNGKPRVTMALSVRVPYDDQADDHHYGMHNNNSNNNSSSFCGCDNRTTNNDEKGKKNDIDHYLIETINNGTSIRLEGSPYVFRSLPLLLEHYCRNGDELQGRLRLPTAVARANSIQALQAIALLGQDFWTSALSGRRTVNSTGDRNVHNVTSGARSANYCNHQISAVCSAGVEAPSMRQRYAGHGGGGAPPTVSAMWTAASPQRSAPITINNPIIRSALATDRPPAGADCVASTSSSPSAVGGFAVPRGVLKKSQSAYGESAVIIPHQHNQPRYRCQPPRADSPHSQMSLRSGGSGGGGGGVTTRTGKFLRGLFSTSNNNLTTISTTQEQQPVKCYDANLSGDYFLPPTASATKRGGALTRLKSSLRGIAGSSRSVEQQQQQRREEKQQQRRALDDEACRKLSDDAIRARQTAFRRRNTDLGVVPLSDGFGGDAQRLAFAYADDGTSPPPALGDVQMRQRQLMRHDDATAAVAHRRQRIHQKIIPTATPADGTTTMPPAAKTAVDEEASRRCIDALWRMESATASASAPIPDANTSNAVKFRTSTSKQQQQQQSPKWSDHSDTTTQTAEAEGGDNGTATTPPIVVSSPITREAVVIGATVLNDENQLQKQSADNYNNNNNNNNSMERCHRVNEEDNSKIPVARNANNFDERGGKDNHGSNDGIHIANTTQPTQQQQQHQQLVINSDESNNCMAMLTEANNGCQYGDANDVTTSSNNNCCMVIASTSSASIPTAQRQQINSIVLRRPNSMSVVSSNSSNSTRQSKIATVRPQQHMLSNSDENEEDEGSDVDKFSSLAQQQLGKSAAAATFRHEPPPRKSREPSTPIMIAAASTSNASSTFYTANAGSAYSPSPPPRRLSEYAQLGDLAQSVKNGREDDRNECRVDKAVTSSSSLDIPQFNEEDAVSVAGTDFNEPWDSNAWDNLLDLARFGDEKSSINAAIKALHSTETIIEEDDLNSSAEDERAASPANTPAGGCNRITAIVSNSNQCSCCHGCVATNESVKNFDRIHDASRDAAVGDDIDEDDDVSVVTPSAYDNHKDRSEELNDLRPVKQEYLDSSKKPLEVNDNVPPVDFSNAEVEATAMAFVLASKSGGIVVNKTSSSTLPRMNNNSSNSCATFYGTINSGGANHSSSAMKSSPSASSIHLSRKNNRTNVLMDHWQQRSDVFIEEEDQENKLDVLNNNTKNAEKSNHTRIDLQQQSYPRLKTSNSFSHSNSYKNSNDVSSKEMFGVLPSYGQTSGSTISREIKDYNKRSAIGSNGDELTLNLGAGGSYGRRRGNDSNLSVTRDTQSLQRMPNYLFNGNNLSGSMNDLNIASLSPIISPPRLRNAHSDQDPSVVLQKYVEQLASDESTLFGANLHRFIECTIDSGETDPYVVVKRVRQFLNGMKNYLVKNGELELHQLIERESVKLNANEFLNIDAIFENVLTKILLVPVKSHLYHLMVRENTRNGQLQCISENLSFIRAMDSLELGFAPGTRMPDTATMEQVRGYLRKMQNHYSPLRKLENLVRALSLAISRCSGGVDSANKPNSASMMSIPGGGVDDSANNNYNNMGTLSSVGSRGTASINNGGGCGATSPGGSGGRAGNETPTCGRRTATFFGGAHSQAAGSVERLPLVGSAASIARTVPGEDLIRWLVYILAKSSTINCEIEAWYMWELLPQQMLTTGDAAYFISTLFSAVHVLKNPDSIRRLKNISHDLNMMGSLATLHESPSEEVADSFLRIAVPNEQEGTIEYHTFPVLPQMNVSKLCRVIAHQFAITNPEDYGLYILYDGFEAALLPREFPHNIRNQLCEAGKPHLFAYKRNDARIAWPKNAVTCSTSADFQPRVM